MPATPAPAEPGILAPAPAERPPPRRGPLVTPEQELELEERATAERFKQLYRPRSNPIRLNLQARAVFGFLGSVDGKVAGRVGGAAVEIGTTWNHVGWALGGTIIGGAVVLKDTNGVMPLLAGGGPTVTIGRLALIRHGMVDLRLGYDFLYGKVVADDQPDDRMPVRGDIADVLTHGPRLQISLGLLANPHAERRFFHGFGGVIGYQALVGSIRGEMPFASFVTFGVSYWMG